MEPVISICCLTYNQAKYVKKTIDGFLEQKVNVPFEIIIHDDCSTDGTAEILQEYARQYPDKIKLLLEKDNQYSQGKLVDKEFVYPEVRGKYFCLCEGDDYWCDPLKLQKQYDAMEQHSDCSICVHKIECIYDDESPANCYFPPISKSEGVITSEEYIMHEIGESKWMFQTSSFFMRAEYLNELLNDTPAFVDTYKKASDFSMILFMLSKGGAYYFSDVMSRYRMQSVGSVGRKISSNREFRINQKEGYIRTLELYDNYTNNKYQEYTYSYIRNSRFDLLIEREMYKEALSSEYKEIYKKQPIKRRIKIRLISTFPRLGTTYINNRDRILHKK